MMYHMGTVIVTSLRLWETVASIMNSVYTRDVNVIKTQKYTSVNKAQTMMLPSWVFAIL